MLSKYTNNTGTIISFNPIMTRNLQQTLIETSVIMKNLPTLFYLFFFFFLLLNFYVKDFILFIGNGMYYLCIITAF